jgi:ACT domain-containing protein
MRNKKLILEQLRINPIVQIACQKSGISRATYYRWCQKDKEFKNQASIALQEGTLLINDLAESQLLAAIKDQNLTAIIFWLKNHHADYTEKIQVSTKDKEIDEKLTPQEERLIKQALILAGVNNLPKSKHDQSKSGYQSNN